MTPPASEGLVVIDVGNTRVGIGIWDEDGVHDVQRCANNVEASWHEPLRTAWDRVKHRKHPAIVIGSVVPRLAIEICDRAAAWFEVDALRVRDDLEFPMKLVIDNTAEVGVDRVCSAAAAFERLNGACAVASFGTAITIDCVSATGEFLGGSILPGLQMSCNALHASTAALPRIIPVAPTGPFGKSTATAIGEGVTMAAVGAMREIVERFATELGRWPQLVLTGGDAPLIREQADFVDYVVPDLCLMGVALAYRKASGQA